MEYVFLHPAIFFQNLAQSWPGVVASGVFAEPWSTETRFSRVDYGDVAKVAALALTADRMTFGTFELCAKGDLDRKDVAALMADVLSLPVAAAFGDPDRGPQEMRPMFDWHDRHSMLGNCVVLEALLGREPRTLHSYFRELAALPAPKLAEPRSATTDPTSTEEDHCHGYSQCRAFQGRNENPLRRP